MLHATLIIFLFVWGACWGSFFNVVVYRLPRGESLITPPSHCPKCGRQLPWYDNLPVIGWIKLGGRCRFCRASISIRYPIVEAVTGGLFVFYYVMFFLADIGPCAPVERQLFATTAIQSTLDIARDWPIYALYMVCLCALLVVSLIDAEHYIIPVEIPWMIAAGGVIVHTIIDTPTTPGALNVGAPAAALAAGAGVGLVLSIALWLFGKMPTSFPDGEPMLEADRAVAAKELDQARREGRPVPPLPPPYTPGQIRREMRKEMAFLLPPAIGGLGWVILTLYVGPVREMWQIVTEYHWLSGGLGAVLGALVGGFVVWLTRILGTLGFGRVAMGLGDVHLMFGVGAVIGAGAATVAFFLAPFFGIALVLYMLITGTRRELPYGPYLSMATAFVMLFYCPIVEYLRPGLEAMITIVGGG